MRRYLLAAMAVAAMTIVLPAQASADTSAIFAGDTASGAPLSCATQSDGVRVCHGDYSSTTDDTRLLSFDSTPLEVYVILPPKPSSGADGPYPLIVQSHGWGSSAGGAGNTEFFGLTGDAWAKAGYAVLQLTARGFGDSCGRSAQQNENPAYYQARCQNGYIRLDDERYEARDVQWAIGLLVDEGVVAAGHIGVTGESYGGGVSLELATLKDRVMFADGTLHPWTSPSGTPLSITASAPVIPWSDLAYALLPNGHTLDYLLTSPTADLSPVGVEKQSFVSGLYALGQKTGYYATPGTNSQADLTTWYGLVNSGEPYDSNPETQGIVTQIAQFHSPYYLLDGAYGTAGEAPSPLLIANGFTDDLFPVDEAIRYYNLERSLYPADWISLFDGDFGHERAANKPGDKALLSNAIQTFFNHYLKGIGSQPPSSATATIETCPTSAPSGGPYTASSWAALHPGEVDYSSAASQTILSSAGDPTIAKTVDPIIAGNNPCGTASGSDQGKGVATYRLPKVTGPGYTLLGSPTVIANLNVTGDQGGAFAFIAARLWDVDTASNTETLVARGLYRMDASKPDGLQVFQLHPGAWHFAAGHVAKLELLGQDSPYARTSNGQFSIAVSDLQLRLSVHERPGTVPGVGRPQPPVTAQPHAAGGSCSAGPSSKLNKRRTHAYRHRLVASGTASDPQCSGGRITHVYVLIYRRTAQGRCRFLRLSGKFTRPRSCSRPIRYRASGRARWRLRLHISIPPGTYLIRSIAVDNFGRRQRWSAASVTRVTVHRPAARRSLAADYFIG
jgi:dienelactone hydrolase